MKVAKNETGVTLKDMQAGVADAERLVARTSLAEKGPHREAPKLCRSTPMQLNIHERFILFREEMNILNKTGRVQYLNGEDARLVYRADVAAIHLRHRGVRLQLWELRLPEHHRRRVIELRECGAAAYKKLVERWEGKVL